MVIFNKKKWYNLSMLHSMTIRLIYVHLLEPFNLCQMPTRGDLGPNLDFHVNCNISFVLYYKIFRQDLCRFNDTTALVFFFFVFYLTISVYQHINISCHDLVSAVSSSSILQLCATILYDSFFFFIYIACFSSNQCCIFVYIVYL